MSQERKKDANAWRTFLHLHLFDWKVCLFCTRVSIQRVAKPTADKNAFSFIAAVTSSTYEQKEVARFISPPEQKIVDEMGLIATERASVVGRIKRIFLLASYVRRNFFLLHCMTKRKGVW